jgi:hypothetical protein
MYVCRLEWYDTMWPAAAAATAGLSISSFWWTGLFGWFGRGRQTIFTWMLLALLAWLVGCNCTLGTFHTAGVSLLGGSFADMSH